MINFHWRSLILFTTLAAIPAANAHHSVAEFDMNQELTIKGTVTEVWYNNPHVRYYLSVTDEAGNETEWDVHTSSVNVLIRRGWRQESVRAGDVVSMSGSPTRSGEPRMLIHTVVLPDGTSVSTRRSDLDR